MTSQQVQPTRDVPPEVPAQLRMNLELLAAAAEFHRTLPAEQRACIEAMSDEEAHAQFVATLAFLPTEIRERIERCVTWLLADLS